MISERTDNLPDLVPLYPPSPTNLNVFKAPNDLKDFKVIKDFDMIC